MMKMFLSTKLAILVAIATVSVSGAIGPNIVRRQRQYTNEGVERLLRRLPGLSSVTRRRLAGEILRRSEILDLANADESKPETVLVIQTTNGYGFKSYRKGQKGVIMYKIKEKSGVAKYIVKFITKKDGTKRSEPIIYEIESSDFKIIKEHNVINIGPDNMAGDLAGVPEKSINEHALQMANSINSESNPETDVVVKITETRRWKRFIGLKTRIAEGQIGVLMKPHPADDNKSKSNKPIKEYTYHVKIVLGKDGNLFKKANFRDVKTSDFEAIHIGPNIKGIINASQQKSDDKKIINESNIISHLNKRHE